MTGAFETDAERGAKWMARDGVAYHAATHADRRACIDLGCDQSFSFAELDTLAARCAGLLRGVLGDPAGQRVASVLRNGVDALVLMYACERTGAIYAPLSWRLTAPELSVLARDCEPQLLVVGAEFADTARQAFPDDVATLVVEVGGGPFRDAVLSYRPEPARLATPDQPCVILYTSGTTGQPKGVLLTWANLFWGAYNFSVVAEVGPDSTMLCDAPMFHTVGLVATSRCVLQQGGMVLLSPAFQPGASLARLSDPALRISHYFGVPQMAQALCDDPAYATADLSRLKGLFLGGAPPPRPLCERLLSDGVLAINGYGMTETSTIAGMPLDADAVQARPASVGIPPPSVEMRIVSPDGRDVATGQTGEIRVRGPAVTPGYWRQPDATAAAFADGWFATGDAGRLDEAGYLTIVDRWKDMYISGGENVYPAEVEAVIAALQGVREVGVIGVPNARWGEVGCAFVARPADGASEAEILAHCRARLARFKQPAHIRFVETLPRTASGKVRKDVLRRQAADLAGARS